MSQGIILGLAGAGGLGCTLHMWWSHRRGRQSACCAGGSAGDVSDEIEALRARHRQLSMLLAEHEGNSAAVTDEVFGPAGD